MRSRYPLPAFKDIRKWKEFWNPGLAGALACHPDISGPLVWKLYHPFSQKEDVCYPKKTRIPQTDTMIRHTVAFTLRHPAGSPEEAAFMEAAQSLTAIPGVTKFEILRQVSPKCDFAFGISMEFADQAELDAYAAHPLHNDFVETQWIPNVSDFQEIDYVPW